MSEQQMPTSEVLNLAADEIQRRGWVGPNDWPADEGYWGGGAASDAPLCLEGGILAAIGVTDANIDALYNGCAAYDAVHQYLVESGELSGGKLYRWNDTSGRTVDEVIAVLRAAAVVAEAREQQPAEVSR